MHIVILLLDIMATTFVPLSSAQPPMKACFLVKNSFGLCEADERLLMLLISVTILNTSRLRRRTSGSFLSFVAVCHCIPPYLLKDMGGYAGSSDV
jgi:hypothetical protein